MTDRIIDLSENAAFISVRGKLLVIELPNGKHDVGAARGARAHDPALPPDSEITVPLEEIAAVVLAHPRITISKTAIADIAASGGIIVTCNEKYVPAAMTLPISGNFSQTERFQRQADAPLPLKKRLWQQVVHAKVGAQARLLLELRSNTFGLDALAEKVRSGDPDNIEAQAARRYWSLLFDDPDFIRDRDAPGANHLLNYGYAILRAVVARAICAAGLHPSLGLHHHNKYDSFCLASDLMEPFRPIVDRAVVQHCIEFGQNASLDKQAKNDILAALSGRFDLDGEMRTLFDIASRSASSLDAVFAGRRKEMIIPDI